MNRLLIDVRSFQAYQSQSFGHLSPPVTPEILYRASIYTGHSRQWLSGVHLEFRFGWIPATNLRGGRKKEFCLTVGIRHPTYRWHVRQCACEVVSGNRVVQAKMAGAIVSHKARRGSQNRT